MAATGKEILDGADPAFAELQRCFDALNRSRSDLTRSPCNIDLGALPADHDGNWYRGETGKSRYHKEDDIQIGALRSDADTLSTASASLQAQLDLIAQAGSLDQHWDDPAGTAALEKSLEHVKGMAADLDRLRQLAPVLQQAVDNIESTLTNKRDAANTTISSLTKTVGAPDTLAETFQQGIAIMQTFDDLRRKYPHGNYPTQMLPYNRGPSGVGTSDEYVRKDIQENIVGAFVTCGKALTDSNTATEQHLREQNQIILECLDNSQGNPQFQNPLGDEFGANKDVWGSLMMSPTLRDLWRKLSAKGTTIQIDSSIQGVGAYTYYDKNGVPHIRVSPAVAQDPTTLQRYLLHELGNSKNILEGRIVSGRAIADVEGRSRLFAIQCQEEIIQHGGPNLREGNPNDPNDGFTKIRALYNEARQSNDPTAYDRAAQQAGKMWGETLLECQGVSKSVYDMYDEGVTCTAKGWAKG